jgi:hypothetical protein
MRTSAAMIHQSDKDIAVQRGLGDALCPKFSVPSGMHDSLRDPNVWENGANNATTRKAVIASFALVGLSNFILMFRIVDRCSLSQ